MKRLVTESYLVDRLPPELRLGLPSGHHVRVVIEHEITDEELRRNVDREIQKGLDSLNAGRSHSAEDVLARIEARLPKVAAAG